LERTEGMKAGMGPANPEASQKRIMSMAKRPVQTAAKQQKPARPEISIERARLVCPHAGNAQAVAESFGLSVPDFDGIRETHESLLRQTWHSFDDALNEKALAMHFQRIVGSYVSSAQGAGNFFSQKVTDARDATTRAANGEEDSAPVGFESPADRARRFAADLCVQAYALLAAAEGAVNAYKEITGEEWKPYVAAQDASQSVERKSAAAELAAFGR